MAAHYLFSDFKKPGAVQLKGFTGPIRRIVHSATNKISSETRGATVTSTLKATPGFVVNRAANQGGMALTGLAVAALASTAFAATTAAAIAGGPITAVVMGAVGIGLLAKDAYSNRDKHHENLSQHVWSLIDDVSPAIPLSPHSAVLEKAASDALYLMKEGDTQFKEMAHKYQDVEKKYKEFIKKYMTVTYPLSPDCQVSGKWAGTVAIESYKTAPPANRAKETEDLAKCVELLNKAAAEGDAMLKKSMAQGGEIFNYMRRLMHMGNYLQCAQIINMATFDKLGIPMVSYGDPFERWPGAINIRVDLKKTSEEIKARQKNFELFKQNCP